jgi:perosamine synthetase
MDKLQKLAVEGGAPIVREPIRPLRSIVPTFYETVKNAIYQICHDKISLSGYLAGSERGGSAVQRLEEMWSAEFGIKHSIAVNSCTSALFAACRILADKSPSVPTTFFVPTMGMSAAAAAPKLCGGKVIFVDTGSPNDFTLGYIPLARPGDVIIAVNLFGHPARLRALRDYVDARAAFLIEDNAQAAWAEEDHVRAGTIGHIGCWSYNVHKPLNAGEGGMLTTNDDALAQELRAFINHGEVSGHRAGLNLRMHELIAVIAMSQMPHAKQIVRRRAEIATGLWGAARGTSAFVMPEEHSYCTSAWYCFAMLARGKADRDRAVKMLNAEGVPCRAGYTLIHKLKCFAWEAGTQRYPLAERLDERMVLIELCGIDPSNEQVNQMAEAIAAVGRELER